MKSTAHVTLGLERGTLHAHLAGPHLGEREMRVVGGELDRAISEAAGALAVVCINFTDVSVVSSLGVTWLVSLRQRIPDRVAVELNGLCRSHVALLTTLGVDRLFVTRVSSLSRAA